MHKLLDKHFYAIMHYKSIGNILQKNKFKHQHNKQTD